jgi:hypothetical protein
LNDLSQSMSDATEKDAAIWPAGAMKVTSL